MDDMRKIDALTAGELRAVAVLTGLGIVTAAILACKGVLVVMRWLVRSW